MAQDLVHNLCESLVENIGGVAGVGKKTPPTPTYLTRWEIVGNSEVRALPYPDGVVLPNGYKRCEYLESDGTAYIELPFGFDKTDEVYIKGAFDETEISKNLKCLVAPKTWNDNTNRFGLGTRIDSGRSNLAFAMYYGSGAYAVSPYIDASTDVCEWEYKNYICTIGSSSANVSSLIFGGETANLRLFYGYNAPTQCKIYEYRHKKGNTEYRLIPCLDSNDTPCMYDVINNQAYYNSASGGSFTYKLYPQPTEIRSCGEYSDVDNKYHIVVLPTGKQAVDIVLDEPLRKVNDIADTLEYPLGTSGKALLTIRVEENDGELSPLDTPTTELVDVPQISEAESYSMVISQGGKAVEWSDFSTD